MAIPLSETNASKPEARRIDDARASVAATAAYYDGLERWTAIARMFRYGGGRGELTVHRALADPRAGGRPTTTRLHDLLLELLPLQNAGRVLDAGCGYGGTMLALARASTASFMGLTLSARQASLGRRAAARAGLADRVELAVRDYDDAPAGPFDAILAVESLAHSPDPVRTLTALCARLAPQGAIAIVDDMPLPAARGTRDLAAFQAGWRTPALASGAEIEATLRACGLTLVVDRDLSSELRPRTLARIAFFERLNRAVRRVTPTQMGRALVDSYRGGLALERLYRHGLMTYRLLVARKN